jgi:hypothetical protein
LDLYHGSRPKRYRLDCTASLLNAAVGQLVLERIDRPNANMTACKMPCFSPSNHLQMRRSSTARSTSHPPIAMSNVNPSLGEATLVSASAVIDRSIKGYDIMLRQALPDDATSFGTNKGYTSTTHSTINQRKQDCDCGSRGSPILLNSKAGH